MRRISLQLLGVILLLGAVTSPAAARRDLSVEYRYEQVWGAAIRMLRVDYGFTIQDRDADNGYLLFDYVDAGRSYPGSVELLRVGQGEDASVRVTLQVSAMPSYVERMLMDRLRSNMTRDYGAPPRRVRRPASPPAHDDDADEAEDDAPASDD